MDEPSETPAETSSEIPSADAELDARGLLCPLPVLKTRKRLEPLSPGDRLRVIADDPAALVDVPHFCAEQGHALRHQSETAEGAWVFVVEKGPA